VTLACGLVLAALAPGASAASGEQGPTAPESINPVALEIQFSIFPGFAGAQQTDLVVALSASQWARQPGAASEQVEQEEVEETAHGFQAGVVELFRLAPRREGAYEAEVFASAAGAAWASAKGVAAWAGEERREHGFKRLSLPTVPGSVALSVFNRRRHAGFSNIFFDVNRCALKASDLITGIHTRRGSLHPAASAAATIEQQLRSVCSTAS
jgi:hypothetical protein